MMMELLAGVKLLKLTLACTIGGVLVTMAKDKDVHKAIKGVKKMMGSGAKKIPGYAIEKDHVVVIGATQYGKTTATIKTLENVKGPVFFFNTLHTAGTGAEWVEAKGSNSIEQIIYGLKNGYKINYLPDSDIGTAGKQLKAIIDQFYQEGRKQINCVICIDEVHLFWLFKSGEGKKANLRLATTGLGFGLQTIWVSQRPALVDNTLYTQARKHIIFPVGKMDEAYLREAKFPIEEIISKHKNERYRFIVFDQMEVTGPFQC